MVSVFVTFHKQSIFTLLIHFVFCVEARTHGVGYYSFSQDESERTVQQEALKKLREETEKNQKVALSVKERRDQLMKQRVAAAKRRKRLRMGLPPDEDEKDEAVIPGFESFFIRRQPLFGI